MRGALAGPAHASILIDAANSVFILDELHAYEPRRLGMILAMVRLWIRLGGRVGVVSATLPAAMADLLTIALGESPHIVEPPGSWTWPARHRLALRTEHLTAPGPVAEITGRLQPATASWSSPTTSPTPVTSTSSSHPPSPPGTARALRCCCTPGSAPGTGPP